jgi:hypothetical protein
MAERRARHALFGGRAREPARPAAQRCVEGEADDPPAAPLEGESWLVGAAPTGAWAERARCLASFQPGAWVFVEPRDGLRVLDRATGQDIRYRGGWQRAVTPAAPTDGATVDNEARAAIATLIAALISGGILEDA